MRDVVGRASINDLARTGRLERPFRIADGPNQRSRRYRVNESAILPSRGHPSGFGGVTGDVFKQSGVELSGLSARCVSVIRAGGRGLSVRRGGF